MTDIVIKAENLGKKYVIGHQAENVRYLALRDVLVQNSRNFWHKTTDLLRGNPIIQGATHEEVWALKDVSFEIQRGEVLGIIGRNGAGKSTLLKVLSRITDPSAGRVTIKGRVASLLEVGTGFHPELTGRENIYLNGAILGMTREEIRRKFDEIVAFAEVEKFLDTPVKRFSSGMYVRLAFAVAAHLEPEILLVDEVLAVGDAEFQKKCLGKIGDVAHQGRTIIFVSHNLAALQNICPRTIVLQNGKVGFSGDTHTSIDYYLIASDYSSVPIDIHPDRKGSGEIKIHSIEVFDNKGNPITNIQSGQDIEIHLNYKIEDGLVFEKILVSLSLNTSLGTPVFLHHNRITKDYFGPIKRNGTFICKINKFPLAPAAYTLGYSVMSNMGYNGMYYDLVENALKLNVAYGDYYATGEIPPATHGFVLINARWELVENKMPSKANSRK